ncbi:MAG TPA: hypothetical protein VI818_06510 [Candidatus Thermoplasmatota archaeon]|nr:hypothetical protein [Candidatus Thermoplasmatota archaeon]
MAGRQEYKLGKLVVKGKSFEFRPPETFTFEGKVGDQAGLYLQYGYKEASRAKEFLHLRFSVKLEGNDLGMKEVKIEDQPMTTDEEWGLLKHETPLAKKGLINGRFTIEGTYTETQWRGKGPVNETPFKHEGKFQITVR